MPREGQPYASHIADMDSDGRQDLVVAGSFRLYVYCQTEFGLESETIWGPGPRRAPIVELTVVDMNADGLLDIYGSVYGDVNLVLEGTGNGTFVDHATDSRGDQRRDVRGRLCPLA